MFSAGHLAEDAQELARRNGMELAQALAHIAPGLPVVITSGFISDEMRQRAAELHVALLQKEYTLERLAGLVHAVLASAPARA